MNKKRLDFSSLFQWEQRESNPRPWHARDLPSIPQSLRDSPQGHTETVLRPVSGISALRFLRNPPDP